MPYDDPDPTDPTVLVGVEAPAEEDTDLQMAYVFAEEFASLGFSATRLLALFRHPFYTGAHRAFQSLGEKKIRSIIQEVLEVWGNFRFVDRDLCDEVDVTLGSLLPERENSPDQKENTEVDHEPSL